MTRRITDMRRSGEPLPAGMYRRKRPMRIAIVDDCAPDAKTLEDAIRSHLDKRGRTCELCRFHGGDDLFEATDALAFDLVFLDVFLDGANGIDIAERLRRENYPGLIIFTTVSSEHAVDGFRVRAFHYLTKPFTPDDIAAALDEAMLLDVMLMLHAEHGGGNNSTFACRVLSSSATDPYSAYAAAIGSLKGPRHGGANAKVVSMHEDIRAHVSNWEDEDEVAAYLGKILDKQAFDGTGLIYGMGHAVYTLSDPRAEVCRRYARTLAAKKDLGEEFALIERIERLAPQVMRDHGMTKPICANIDLYTGFIYKMLGVPETLFTPLFAVARMAGWSAHRMEELFCAHRIIRPAYRPVIEPLEYKPLADR